MKQETIDPVRKQFLDSQMCWSHGTRVIANERLGFIDEWSVGGDHSNPRGSFSVIYDDGDYQRHDSTFLYYTFKLLDNPGPLRNIEMEESSLLIYRENLFLGGKAMLAQQEKNKI